MKILQLLGSMLLVITFAPAIADDDKTVKTKAQATPANPAPQMSEIPVMKEQGKRMAELMQKIQEVNDPAERKRMLAEAICPQ